MQCGQRDSSIELYRIIVMLAIIAHHYVVNSGLLGVLHNSAPSVNSAFLYAFGAWGKVGINCFVLITGYFMCEKNISLKKFLKLYLQMVFYCIICNCLFWTTGYAHMTWKWPFYTFFQVSGITSGYFGGAFLVFFLTIPFLNILVNHMTEMQHRLLLALLIPVYTIFPFFPGIDFAYNHVEWYAILYFISSYIKKYPLRFFDSAILWGAVSVAALICGLVSVWFMAFISPIKLGAYYWLIDSNKFTALLCAIAFFLFFKNLKLGYSRVVNTVASTCFGVFLIHTNSNAMRRLLWRDVCDCVGWADSPYCIPYAIGCVILIFIVCSLIDMLRQRFIEKPLFKCLERFGVE